MIGPTLSGKGYYQNLKIKLLHSRYYTEACNEWRDPSLSAWLTQKRLSGGESLAALCLIWLTQESNPRPPAPIVMYVLSVYWNKFLLFSSSGMNNDVGTSGVVGGLFFSSIFFGYDLFNVPAYVP